MLQDGHVSSGQGELKISLGPVRLAEVDPTQTNHVKGFANFVAAGESLQEAVEFVSGLAPSGHTCKKHLTTAHISNNEP